MSEIILDECLYYLREAERYLEVYKEIDLFEEIFETYKPDTQLKIEQNAKAKTGVMGSLTKACNAVIKMIRNIIDSISDFFAKRKMDDKQRKAYEAFKIAASKDPLLKNKKVTVKDFTKLNADYESILREAEAADRELAKGKSINTDILFSKITDFCGNVGKGVLVSVGAEAALSMASSSTDIAKKMYKSLKEDEALEKQLIDAIGKKETKRFEHEMKSLGKRVSLHRMIMKMKGTYATSVQGAIDNTLNNVVDLVGNISNITSTTGNNDPELSVKGNALQRAKGTASYIGKNFKTLATNGAGIAKNYDIIRRAYGNNTIRKTVKDTIKTKSQMTKDARKDYKQLQQYEKKRIKKENKKKLIQDQSAMDSLLGRNDPNSFFNRNRNSN